MRALRGLAILALLTSFLLSPVPSVAGTASHKSTRTKKTVVVHKKKSTRRPVARHAPPPKTLHVSSRSAVVYSEDKDKVLFSKQASEVMPIASITKLMSAMVALDAGLPLGEVITVTEADVDTLRNSSSRLRVGTRLPRRELLRLALMSSENRATAAIARTTFPGGTAAFVLHMNRKAAALGMTSTHFEDPTGLSEENVSTALDLVKLVQASTDYELIREFTTTASYRVDLGRRHLQYKNTNPLVRKGVWDIDISKTGYINEAGRCLAMQTQIANHPTIIVLLKSRSTATRTMDAQRIKRWLEYHFRSRMAKNSLADRGDS